MNEIVKVGHHMFNLSSILAIVEGLSVTQTWYTVYLQYGSSMKIFEDEGKELSRLWQEFAVSRV